MIRRIAVALTLALGASVLVAPIAVAEQSPKKIISGWLPWWKSRVNYDYSAVQTTIANADVMREVSPFWYGTTVTSGSMRVRVNPGISATQVNSAKKALTDAGLVLLPAVADGSNSGEMAKTLADPASRKAHVQQLVDLAMTDGYSGIDLDYEKFAFSDGQSTWAATKPNWTAFIQELSDALHAKGKLLSVTIPPPCNYSGQCGPTYGYWVYNFTEMGKYADVVRVMAYDYHWSVPGAIAPFEWVESIVAYAASAIPPGKFQIGVATYGRTWTRKTSGGAYRVTGTCPKSSGGAKEKAAFNSNIAMASVDDNAVPGVLAAAGLTQADVQWDDKDKESWFNYDKTFTWTDDDGTANTCTAKKQLWFSDNRAIKLRVELVGKYNIGGAAFWSLGAESSDVWPDIRAYAQSIGPVRTSVSLTAPRKVSFGTPVAMSATVTGGGAPVADLMTQLQWQASGKKKWQNLAEAVSGIDGVATYSVAVPGPGALRVKVLKSAGFTNATSAAKPLKVASTVTAKPRKTTIDRRGQLVVRVKARPATKGQLLRLQQQSGSSWKVVGSAKATTTGAGVIKIRVPSKRGKLSYRVVATKFGTVTQGVSGTFTVKVR